MILPKLTKEQQQAVTSGIENFKGHLPVLESAIGALVLGNHFGWRVLKLIHSPATYKQYEQLLGIEFQDVCPERGPLAHKSVGLALADKLKSFWAVATGKKKWGIDKAEIMDEKDIAGVIKHAD